MKDILITSSVLILALTLLRFLFRRTVSRRVQYALWGLVLLRLLIPLSLPALKYSVLTAAEPVIQSISAAEEASVYPEPNTGYPSSGQETVITVPGGEVHRAGESAYTTAEKQKETVRYRRFPPIPLLRLVWYGGMGLMALLFLLTNLRFAVKLRRTRVPLEGAESKYPVYLCDDIPSPCLFGLLRPAIYVTTPAARDPEALGYVIAHEETHARHLDPLWSLLRSLCLVVWWFDPLVWLAAYLSKQDCELACDEGVLKRLGEAERLSYGETLLALIPLRRGGDPLLSATTMTAGKRQMKDRIRRIAERRKPLIAALIAALVLAGVVCACTFTGAKRGETAEPAGTEGPAGSETPAPSGEPAPSGTYASPEAYLETLMGNMEGLTYSSEETAVQTPEFRVAALNREGELSGLDPQGTLELYSYQLEARFELDREDILSIPGVTYVTEDGWCDWEDQHFLILLRYPDGSVAVLHDRVSRDDMGSLYYYQETTEEMLYDWYVRTNGLDLPAWTVDLLPTDQGGNHPGHRYDGDGWYLYIPVAGWEEQSGEGISKWVSRYRTGSSIRVTEASQEELTGERPELLRGQAERYAEGADGRLWHVFTQYDPQSITDTPEIKNEPSLLEAMLESFTLPGGRELLRRTPEQTVPLTLGEQLRAAADRIFGTSQVPAAGPCFLSVAAEGRRDEYRLVPGQYWSLNQNMGFMLTSVYYKWHSLTEEEIAAVVRNPTNGPVMEIWNETDRFTVYADSDALLWTELESGTEHWLCPVPRGNYTQPIYDYFLNSTARAAEMYRPEAQITVPGTVTDYAEVARLMAEQYAAILLDRPSWYVGVPQDAAVKSFRVFEAYYGEDRPNFCFNMCLYLKLSQDPADPDRSYFEAGAGLRDPVAEGPYAGWYEWGGEVTAALEDGVWRFLGMGTGGSCAWLPYGIGYGFPAEAGLGAAQLLDLYFLTSGNTREWRIMYALAHAPAEELRAELMKLSEEQRQLLCGSMEAYNAVYGAVEGDEDDWYGCFDLEAYR